jgi:chromosome segregation ATPase
MEEIETGSESTESGASEGSSSEASGNESTSNTEAAQAAPKQDTTPFHEHPRFKELVEQKNEWSRKYQEQDARYKQLEQQLNSFQASQPKAPSETDSLLADLKKVDPRLANALEKTLKAAEIAESNKQSFEQFQQQSQQAQFQQTLQTAVGKINVLHETNKMSDFGKQFINNQLDLAYRNGKLNASDLKAVESAYQEAAKTIKSFEDSFKRDVTKGYVQDKAKDASVPASLPKGTQAKPAPKAIPTFKSKDELRQAAVKAYLKESAAHKAATNN